MKDIKIICKICRGKAIIRIADHIIAYEISPMNLVCDKCYNEIYGDGADT